MTGGAGGGPVGPPPVVSPGRRVARLTGVFTRASTAPAAVETADGRRWVMKLSGSGPGPFGLLTEFLALRIARACAAPVPAASPLWLAEGFPWQVGTDEFDATLQRSWGWNLGVALIEDARPVTPAELAGFDPTDLRAIARADAIVQNVDRTARNPNLLAAGGRLHAIDFDACLYLSRALGPPRAPVRTLPAGHLLAGFEGDPRAPVLDAAALIADAPDAWIATTGTDRAGLAAALRSYLAGYA